MSQLVNKYIVSMDYKYHHTFMLDENININMKHKQNKFLKIDINSFR
jgi:hypothetical protein